MNQNFLTSRQLEIGNKSSFHIGLTNFLTDSDSEEMLDIFRRITDSGLHLAFMGHFNHLNELSTSAVKSAIKEIRKTGAQIRNSISNTSTYQ